jgi:hypothetical protein
MLKTTGTLELVGTKPPAIEDAPTGGTVRYSITGGTEHSATLLGETWPHYRWTGRFTHTATKRTLQLGFMMGLGLPGVPTATEILASAFSDAATVEYESFESWAYDLGYDLEDGPESKRASRIYNACVRMGERLERFFGSDREVWATALEAVNR